MPPYDSPRRLEAFPPLVSTLLVVNGLAFIAQQLAGAWVEVLFALWPLGTPDFVTGPYGVQRVPPFELWQIVSYSFLHGNTLHLFTNLFALWMFGIQLEYVWGSGRFALYYFVCVVGAGLVQLVVTSYSAGDGAVYPTIGASGGVFGILLAFGMMFPNQRIMLLIPPIPLKAKWFVILYGLFELWAGFTGTLSEVAHFAHLGGMFFGLLLILYWRRAARQGPSERF